MSTKGTRRYRALLTKIRPNMSTNRGKGICRCGVMLVGQTEKRRGTCGPCHRLGCHK